MSEILDDANPDDDGFDEDEDEDDIDEALEELDRDYAASSWSTTLKNPVVLAVTALVVAIVSMLGLLSTYLLVNAILLAHPTEGSVFSVRVSGLIELGLALLAVVLAYLAHGEARVEPELPAHRIARWIAGAALLLAIVSIAESGASLLILLAAHVPSLPNTSGG
ncbi:MAG TPA: hypothetical protein VIJ31_02860 [Acidothermaceae bacterium]